MRVLVFEDDISAALEIELILNEIGDFDIDRIESISSANKYIKTNTPEMIIADIILDDGKSSLKWLLKNASDIPLIVVTNNFSDEFYRNSKSLNALAYLMKPIDAVTLQFQIERIIERNRLQVSENGQRVKISDGNIVHIISVGNICWVRTEGNYSSIKTPEKKIVLKVSLTKIMAIITHPDIIRVHRSALVHINKIKSLDLKKDLIHLSDDSEIPIGKSYRSDLLRKVDNSFDTF